jgi:hypothetical protein
VSVLVPDISYGQKTVPTWSQFRCHIFGTGNGENSSDENLRFSVQLLAPLFIPADSPLLALQRNISNIADRKINVSTVKQFLQLMFIQLMF